MPDYCKLSINQYTTRELWSLREAVEGYARHGVHGISVSHEKLAEIGAKDAANLLMNEDFSLVITDLLMPYMTGLELITLLRHKLNKQTPVIVLSRIGLENTVLKAFELGADDYVVKPFSPNELMIRAKKLVSR